MKAGPRGRGDLAELGTIPGVGSSIVRDLSALGIRRVADLKGRNPDKMYREPCRRAGLRLDRFMLYVYRCAVYCSSTSRPDPAKLKRWNWKD